MSSRPTKPPVKTPRGAPPPSPAPLDKRTQATPPKPANGIDEALMEELHVDHGKVREEFTRSLPPLYPGDGYVFELPQPGQVPQLGPAANNAPWSSLIIKEDGVRGSGWRLFEHEGKRRVSVNVPLVLVDAPYRSRDRQGETHDFFISNMSFAFKDQKTGQADDTRQSPLYYLLRSLGSDMTGLTNQADYMAAFVACLGKRFKAQIDWRAECSAKRAARFYNPESDREEVADEKSAWGKIVGCGTKYRVEVGQKAKAKKIPRDAETGDLLSNFGCIGLRDGNECNAVLRVNMDLRNFRAI